MGYSWDIHRVFMEYTYVSGMYRVCVGYVSGMYRKKQGASGFFEGLVERNRSSCSLRSRNLNQIYLTTMATTLRPNRTRSDRSTDREIRISLGRYKGDGTNHGRARMDTEKHGNMRDRSSCVEMGLQDETRTRVWHAAISPLPKIKNFRGPQWQSLNLQ